MTEHVANVGHAERTLGVYAGKLSKDTRNNGHLSDEDIAWCPNPTAVSSQPLN